MFQEYKQKIILNTAPFHTVEWTMKLILFEKFRFCERVGWNWFEKKGKES